MDSISLKCSECDQLMKFPASRAGKKARCTKCGAEFTIPSEEAAPPPSPPPPKKNDDDDDEGDGSKTYDLVTPPEEKKKLAQEKKEAEKPKHVIEKKKKKLQNVKKWMIVQKGLALMFTGAGLWGIIFAVHVLILLLASTQDKEYNVLRNVLYFDLGQGNPNNLDDDENPLKKPAMPDSGPPANPETTYSGQFLLGLVAGQSLVVLTRTLLIVLTLATLGKIAIFVMSYLVLLASPPRFGAKGQAKALIFMALVNASIVVLFRLLPLLSGFLIITPFYSPEIPMVAANAEREVPLHVFYCGWPALEMIATLLFVCSLATESVLAAIYLHTVGLSLKEEGLRESASSLVNNGLGAGFVLICYYLLSMTGTSDVLISLLQLTFLLGTGLQALFLVRFIMLLNKTRDVLKKRIEERDREADDKEDEDDEDDDYDDDDDDDDDDDEDDDDEPVRKKKKKKSRARDDDDDEPDDDDDRPRKRKRR